MASFHFVLLAFVLTLPAAAYATSGPNVGGGGGKTRPDRCYATNGKDGNVNDDDAPSPAPNTTVPGDEEDYIHGMNGDAGCFDP